MPQLENLKWEQFCRKMLRASQQGLSQGWAYGEVYKVTGRVADTAASRLLKNEQIRKRIAELAAPAERRAKLSAADAIAKLDRVYTGALSAEQYSAAGRAAEVQSKISGLMIDKLEVGRVGDFSACNSVEEVTAKMLQDLADPREALATLDEMRAALADAIANEATMVEDARPPDKLVDEVQAGIELIKPRG
jgi:terminase small subunit-like protein